MVAFPLENTAGQREKQRAPLLEQAFPPRSLFLSLHTWGRGLFKWLLWSIHMYTTSFHIWTWSKYPGRSQIIFHLAWGLDVEYSFLCLVIFYYHAPHEFSSFYTLTQVAIENYLPLWLKMYVIGAESVAHLHELSYCLWMQQKKVLLSLQDFTF